MYERVDGADFVSGLEQGGGGRVVMEVEGQSLYLVLASY